MTTILEIQQAGNSQDGNQLHQRRHNSQVTGHNIIKYRIKITKQFTMLFKRVYFR